MSGKIVILLLSLSMLLFGKVEVKVDKQNVIEGDNISFSIIVSGEKVSFPKIDKIGGYDIEGESSSENISFINGKYSKLITKTYIFTPLKSFEIPSFEIEVDGKKEKTTPIKIKVLKDKKTDKNFKLEVITNKEAIVGYSNLLTIKFYRKTNKNIDLLSLKLPKGDFKLKIESVIF